MKVFSVTGLTGSGKTTTIEYIIKELKRRGYSVGTVKEIHYENFKIDIEGKNTYRHRIAGADTVTALALNETDVMYPYKMDIYKLLSHYHEDYVILEGATSANVPNISTANDLERLSISPLTFIVSGVISNTVNENYGNIPVISALNDIIKLTDRIEELVPDLMPDIDSTCCGQCGANCRELLARILRGEASSKECVIRKSKVKLTFDGKVIDKVEFVDRLLYNAVIGVVKELRGYREGLKIKIEL